MDTAESHRVDKGKARAQDEQPTEQTPLLASSSGSLTSSRAGSLEHPSIARRRLYSRLLSVFLISLSSCVVLFVFLAILAYTWRSRASTTRPEEIIQRSLVVRGPDKVDVLNATKEEGVWLMVHGHMGLDAGSVVGVNSDEEDGVWQSWWKSVGRWGIRRLDRVTVTLSSIDVRPRSHNEVSLAVVTIPPLEVPLTPDPPPQDFSWLTPVQIPVQIKLTKDLDVVLQFIRDSWKDGFVSVEAFVGTALVQGGGLGDNGWRSLIQLSHTDIRPTIKMKIPKVPGLPLPGANNPLPTFSDLVSLRSFRITSSSDTISLEANASAINPVPVAIDTEVPSLPFIISLPTPGLAAPSVAVASVHSDAFNLTRPNISLSLSGTVLPLPRNSSNAISAFVSEYISGRDADIQITTPLAPGLVVNTTFPAPHPRPEILRNVSITDMKIKPLGTGMVASGVVHALVVLPQGINVGVNASRVFPDVLVFDGPVPSPTEDPGLADDPLPTQPLPDPLPAGAFAHIVPEDWLPAECEPTEGPEGSGATVAVSAKIDDVPLEVLPGREREFSNFVSKVIFGSQGAVAGVQGVAAVAVRVEGLPFANGRDGEMELSGLRFQGSVRIGKRSS